jgi:Ca2+-binding RTX toxin-like protein
VLGRATIVIKSANARKASGIMGSIALAIALAGPVSAGAVTLRPGDILVTDAAGVNSTDGAGGVIRVDPATGKQTRVSANNMAVNSSSAEFSLPEDLIVTPGGQILVGDYGNTGVGIGTYGGVIGVDPATGQESVVSANSLPANSGSSEFFSSPNGIARAPNGNLVVSDHTAFTGAGGVIGVNPATGKETKVSANDLAVNAGSAFFTFPERITLNPRGLAFVADDSAFGGTGGVIGVDRSSGLESDASSNDLAVNSTQMLFDDPYGIARSPGGRLFVADYNAFANSDGGVIGVDPATGQESRVSANEMGVNAAHQLFVNPTDIAVTPSGGLLVADLDAFSDFDGGVIGVDAATGRESVVSSNDQAVNSSSQLLSEPYGIAVVPPKCFGRFATIVGGPRGETLRGTRFADVIAGVGKDDTVRGLEGRDRICGGSGDDTLFGGAGQDRISGGTGDDTLFGGDGADVLVGGTGHNELHQ